MTRLSDSAAPLELRRVRVDPAMRAGDVGRCCFDHITTTFDERGDPVAGVVDDFLCDVDRVRDEALGRAAGGDNTRWNQYVKPPVEDGTKDGCFISKGYDATTHFETTVRDVLEMYTRITGKELDLSEKELGKE